MDADEQKKLAELSAAALSMRINHQFADAILDTLFAIQRVNLGEVTEAEAAQFYTDIVGAKMLIAGAELVCSKHLTRNYPNVDQDSIQVMVHDSIKQLGAQMGAVDANGISKPFKF